MKKSNDSKNGNQNNDFDSAKFYERVTWEVVFFLCLAIPFYYLGLYLSFEISQIITELDALEELKRSGAEVLQTEEVQKTDHVVDKRRTRFNKSFSTKWLLTEIVKFFRSFSDKLSFAIFEPFLELEVP